ncbi:MAG: hypothetical protein LYZ66_04740 [Nitrososphaerales archaeon]|nr:hypothetical protein [Nitrososphaerales archaeon]
MEAWQRGYLKNDGAKVEVGIQEEMIWAVVDLAEDKGVASGKEIEGKIRKRLEKRKKLSRVG